jgi:hypothetical protein
MGLFTNDNDRVEPYAERLVVIGASILKERLKPTLRFSSSFLSLVV